MVHRLALLVAAALLTAACHDMQQSPVAPTATMPAAVPAAPPPAPPPAAFTVDIGANGGTAYLGEPWSATLSVSSSAGGGSGELPASVSVRCGADAVEQTMGGFVGLRVVTCWFPAAGSYAVSAAAVAASGVTTTGSTTIAVTPRPVPPPPPPAPAPRPPAPPPPTQLVASMTCVPKAAKTATPCNVAATYGDRTVTGSVSKVVWEYGDGAQATLEPGITSAYAYAQAGTYQVIAWVYWEDKIGKATTTLTIP